MISQISKSVKSELQEIERLIAKTELSFRRAFSEYLKTLKSEKQLRTIRQFLQNGNVEGLIAHFNQLQKPFPEIIAITYLAAGKMEAATLQPKAQRYINSKIPSGQPKPQVGIEFQIANPKAAAILQEQTETLIREINDQQRKVIYDILQQAQLQGGHPRGLKGLAEEIRDNIGLTQKQQQAVRNYERLLRAGSKEALQRDLRAKTFDRRISAGKQLSEYEIQRAVSAYRSRYEKYRADTIARTESKKAVERARYEALEQNMERLGLSNDEVKLQWNASSDLRVRDTHLSMNGQKRQKGEPFVSPSGARLLFPGDTSLGAGASEVISCRCVVRHEIG